MSAEPASADRATRLRIHMVPYQGIVRFVYLRPISAAWALAGPTMTPSLIMSTTFSVFIELRKKIFAALVAANTLARAAAIGAGSGPEPFFTPSDSDMSPGPHSANAMPGTFAFSSALASAHLSSSFNPSSSSPFGFSGQVSALSRYSSWEMPQIRAAVEAPCTPRRPSLIP